MGLSLIDFTINFLSHGPYFYNYVLSRWKWWIRMKHFWLLAVKRAGCIIPGALLAATRAPQHLQLPGRRDTFSRGLTLPTWYVHKGFFVSLWWITFAIKIVCCCLIHFQVTIAAQRKRLGPVIPAKAGVKWCSSRNLRVAWLFMSPGFAKPC